MSLSLRLGLALMLLSPLIWAQQRISGKVLDQQTGEPLVGAHVYLLKNWKIGTATDTTGGFALRVPATVEEDSLIISYLGYQEFSIKLQTARERELYHLQTTSALWQEVVVTAKPLIAEEFKYVKIQKMQIYTNPAAKADPILAVNSLPAATTIDESANISLRGSSPQETGVILNGIPLYQAVRYTQLNGSALLVFLILP